MLTHADTNSFFLRLFVFFVFFVFARPHVSRFRDGHIVKTYTQQMDVGTLLIGKKNAMKGDTSHLSA